MRAPGPIRRLDAAALPYLLGPGLGFASVVISSAIAPFVIFRLAPRLFGPPELKLAIMTLLAQAWAWAVLPGLLYAVSRAVKVGKWAAPITGTLTGLLFVMALTGLSTGVEGLVEEHPVRKVIVYGTSLLGVFLSQRAILAGQLATERAHEAAKKAAEAKKSQYDEFAREAERLAALSAAREETRANEEAPAPKTGTEA